MPKVINISANEAGDIKYLPDDTVLISINEEYGELYDLQLDRNSSKILTVRFSDCCANYKILDGTIFHPISDETTLEILKFIRRNDNKNFLIHCAAGVSRSGAIAFYLNMTYGHELKGRFWQLSSPNFYVFGKLSVFNKFNKYEQK